MFSNILFNKGAVSPANITRDICKEFSEVYKEKKVFQFCEVHFEDTFLRLDKEMDELISDKVGMDGELDLMELAGESLYAYCYLNVCLHYFKTYDYFAKNKKEILRIITTNYQKYAPGDFQIITDTDRKVVTMVDHFFSSLFSGH